MAYKIMVYPDPFREGHEVAEVRLGKRDQALSVPLGRREHAVMCCRNSIAMFEAFGEDAFLADGEIDMEKAKTKGFDLREARSRVEAETIVGDIEVRRINHFSCV